MAATINELQAEELRALRAEVAHWSLALAQLETRVERTIDLPARIQSHEISLGRITIRLDCFFETLRWMGYVVLGVLCVLTAQQIF